MDSDDLKFKALHALTNARDNKARAAELHKQAAKLRREGNLEEARRIEMNEILADIPGRIVAFEKNLPYSDEPTKGSMDIMILTAGEDYDLSVLDKKNEDLRVTDLKGTGREIMEFCLNAFRETEFQVRLFNNHGKSIRLILSWG